MKVTIITDGVKLNALIVAIGTHGKKHDAMIQQAGVSALAALLAHGDVGFVNRLYLGVNKGVRKAALTSWLLAHGSLVANTEGNKKEKPFNFTKDKVTNVEAAQADPWFDHKPDAEPDAVYDLQKAIAAIVKKADGAKELAHGEALPELQRILATMAGVEFLEVEGQSDPVDGDKPSETPAETPAEEPALVS